MGNIEFIAIDAADAGAAESFCDSVFGLGDRVRVQESQAPTSGFRGFTVSLLVAQPATVREYFDRAVEAGASALKPPAKSLWGYGGAIQAPDGTVWTLASSAKKDAGPAVRQIDGLVLQLGVDDVAASKQFYVDRGLTVAKSYGRKYVEFDTGAITLSLLKRSALAKTAGLSDSGEGSHRLVIGGDTQTFVDPDGFAWHAV